MDKKQIREVAQSVFSRYKDKDKVFVTSDGQAFFEYAHAKNHATRNRTGKELGLDSFRRDDMQDKESTGNTAKDVVAKIESMTTTEEVQAVLDAENAGAKRKTVIEAGEKKLNELKAE